MNAPVKQNGGIEAYLNLDEIVADLRKLRAASQKRRYREGRLPELPSREAMKSIVDGLLAVLYPRHFGPPELTVDCTDGFLLYTLSATLRSLQEQVRRELHLHSARTEHSHDDEESRSLEIVREFAASLPKWRAVLDTDIHAAFVGDPAAKSLDEVVFCYPGVSALISHRLAHQLYLQGVTMLARIIAEAAHSATAIDIHPGARIGEGFFIDHGTGVVIGETAVIGRNVRVYQAVTLGAKRFETAANGALVKGQPRHPTVEDDVVIYAGATILGRITIGRGSTIGGSVWLTHSVPPGSNITQAKECSGTFDNGGGI